MRRFALVALLLATESVVQAAVEAETARFRVLTALEPDIAYAAAAHLERVRAAYHALGLVDFEKGRLPVILFQDVAELERVTQPDGPYPGFTRGFFRPGSDQDYAGVAWEGAGSPEVALAHEYAHHLFRETTEPLWFREGIAEYLARIELTETEIRLGPVHPGLLKRLQTEAWIPLADLLATDRKSGLVGHPNFFPQSWLLVHWLMSLEGDLDRARPEVWNRYLQDWGVEAVEEKLRRYVEEPLPVITVPARAAEASAVRLRELDEWELPYWLADLGREIGLRDEARSKLQALAKAFPHISGPSESLGALEMDAGHYEEAERMLASAVVKGSTNPRTHYRYSLMLMRPVEDGYSRRALRAVEHASQARQDNPHEPKYVFTEAQARMLAAQWSEAARLLSTLVHDPEWRQRAEREFAELTRRRQQELAHSNPPELPIAPEGPFSIAFLEPTFGPVPKPLAPRQPSPPRVPPVRRGRTWPPPGTILAAGRIGGVECRGDEKFVTVTTRHFRIRLREKANAPAKLYHPPLKWQELPCDTRGWVVNVIYRPTPKDREVRGVLVGVVF